MGLFRSDDSTSEQFEPLVSDGHRILGRYDDPDKDGTRLVWVKADVFEQIDENKVIDN